MELPPNYTSTNFEKVALAKFRALASCLPLEVKVFREPWGRSIVLCLDFKNCPDLFSIDREQTRLIVDANAQLGLASAIVFRIGSKTVGWKTMKC